ncbi:MAG: HAMP domain-containing sensor histidine kinase [Nonlabens sp.]
MKDRKYVYLLILISLVILTTLSIQVYWNYKNFKESEQQLVADVQTTLDQSVEQYFTKRAKDNTLGVFFNGGIKDGALDAVFRKIDEANEKNDGQAASFSSIKFESSRDLRVIQGAGMDSLKVLEDEMKRERSKRSMRNDRPENNPFFFPEAERSMSDSNRFERLPFLRRYPDSTTKLNGSTRAYVKSTFTTEEGDSVTEKFLMGKGSAYSGKRFREEISNLTSRIVFSMTDDTIDLDQVDSIFRSNLDSKKISLDHYMAETPQRLTDTLHWKEKPFKAVANSSLIKNGKEISVHYGNLTVEVLKRNLTGILLSFILVASVIFCLFYLLVVINNQKELSSMKNDLISNITHEFKTPIATAGAALEGVQSFTATGDTEKTNRYLAMGREQLVKLNIMVEKLLETATLDSKDLALQKSQVDLNDLIQNITSRFKSQTEKSIGFQNELGGNALNMADPFHLENALNNLVDNAIKYGGEEIKLTLDKRGNEYVIAVSDSGTALDSKHAKRIFDKFYRVGHGNQHNVKGFGIGLFYTKAIIEKHDGTIDLETKPNTTFKIRLPYE